MTDRSYDAVTATGRDETGDWFLWDCREKGQFVAHYNTEQMRWTSMRLPNPAASKDAVYFVPPVELADAPRHSAEVEDENDD